MDEEAEREQDERREYVKNIGIEYRYGCYEEKRADSCHILAEYLEAIEQNFKNAFALFKQNCEERKYPRSCHKFAMYTLAGKYCEPSLKNMIEPLHVGCDKGNLPPSCRYLGLVYWNGEKDRPADSQKAEKYMKKACELEDEESCWLLSTWYMGKTTKFSNKGGKAEKLNKEGLGELPRDMEKALKYGEMACELGSPYSCANVARMLKLGDGVPKDEEKAKHFMEKAQEIMKLYQGKTDHSAGFTG